MRSIITLLKIFALTSLLLGCNRGGGSINLNVKAKSAEGFPIAGAIIAIDDEVIGQTNSFGTFMQNLNVEHGIKHKLTLTKDDEQYYFAPHVEIFSAESDEKRDLNITALMYTVPKPKKSKKEKNLEPSIDVAAEGSVDKATRPTPSGSEALPLLTIKSGHLKNSAAISEKSQNSNGLFTVHVYSGRFPVNNAHVTFFSNEGKKHECISNDRGRCVIETASVLPVQGMLVVQREGYRSFSNDLDAKDSSNNRVNIEPGSSLDLTAEVTGPWASKPAENIELRIKNQKPATPSLKTNKAGFVSIPIDAKFPIDVEITNITTGATQKHTIEDSQTLHIQSRFSDESTSGWSKWTRYPIHLSQDAAKDSGLVDYERLEATLKNKYPNQNQGAGNLDVTSIQKGEIALLPVVQKEKDAFKMGLVAFNEKGKVAQSLFTPLALSSVTEEQWLKAYDAALKNLNQKLPWAGTVKGIKNRELIVAINTEFLDRTDRITIDTQHGPMSGTITKLSRNDVRVSLDVASHLSSTDLQKLIGSRAEKIIYVADAANKFDENEITNLVSIKTEHKARRLAKKYLAESNPEEAVQILLSSVNTEDPSLDDLQLAASIENSRGKTDKLLSILQIMLNHAAKHNLNGAIPIIEANILLVQVESMLPLEGESSAAERFLEIKSIAQQLKSEISPALQTTPEAIALSYIILTAQQKAAESKADLLALATMADAWKVFENSLGSNSDLANVKIWKTYASRQKDRSSLDSANEKTPL